MAAARSHRRNTGAAGHKHVCARLFYKRGCLRVDPAINLQLARRVDLHDSLMQLRDLRQLIGHEALSAETWLHRHDQRQIQQRQDTE